MEAVVLGLDPVSEFTDILSAEKYVTISAVKPMITLLESKILEFSKDEHKSKKDMKIKISSYMIDKYSSETTASLCSVSTFLDPRSKTDAELIKRKP